MQREYIYTRDGMLQESGYLDHEIFYNTNLAIIVHIKTHKLNRRKR